MHANQLETRDKSDRSAGKDAWHPRLVVLPSSFAAFYPKIFLLLLLPLLSSLAPASLSLSRQDNELNGIEFDENNKQLRRGSRMGMREDREERVCKEGRSEGEKSADHDDQEVGSRTPSAS